MGHVVTAEIKALRREIVGLRRDLTQVLTIVRRLPLGASTPSTDTIEATQAAQLATMQRNAERAAGETCQWCAGTGFAIPDGTELAVPCDHTGPPVVPVVTETERPSPAVNLAAVRATRAMAKEGEAS